MQGNTPILDGLIRHAQHSRVPLHVPGHKQGRLLPSRLSHWLGAAAQIDLTELPELDNLHQPTGCIAQSQQLAADHYGSRACFYSVNGSTACVMAAIMSTVPPGGTVLFLNPFHQSAWRGLVMADAWPLFHFREFDVATGTWSQSTIDKVAQALDVHPSISAVYVTSPTYQGAIAPVRNIAEVVHQRGIPLIVDEAHGAHLGLSAQLAEHSVAAGADLVIHSVHKMLPSLTQTAWIHCQGHLVDPERVRSALSMLQSSSPSYLLLASIDVAQAWLRTEAAQVVEKSLTALAPLRAMTSSHDMMITDPFRQWVPMVSLRESRRFAAICADRGIFVEYADASGVLTMWSLQTRPREVELYLQCYERWQEGATRSASPVFAENLNISAEQELNLSVSPRAAYLGRRRLSPIQESRGHIAASLITPYPPGVPIVWPGQRIDDEIIRRLIDLSGAGLEVHGVFDQQIEVLA